MEVASKAPSPVKPSGQEKLLLSENEALKNQLRKSVPIAEYANLQAELQTAKVEQDTLTRRLELTVSPTKNAGLQRELDAVTVKYEQAIATQQTLYDEQK